MIDLAIDAFEAFALVVAVIGTVYFSYPLVKDGWDLLVSKWRDR